MATIKTVANLWKLEKQNKHANEIARQAGNLYDKFAGFLGNMEDIGKALQKANEAHQRGIGQLTNGSGNLIGRVLKLRELGIRSKKDLPASFIEKVSDYAEEHSDLKLQALTEDPEENDSSLRVEG